MSIKKKLNFCLTSLAEILLVVLRQEHKLGETIMKQEDLVLKLQTLTAQTNKSLGEIRGKMQEYLDALNASEDTELAPEVEQALNSLIAAIQNVDDVVPDVVVEPAPVEPAPVEEIPVEPVPVEPAPVEEIPAEPVPVEEPQVLNEEQPL